jgi:hypothetical protein
MAQNHVKQNGSNIICIEGSQNSQLEYELNQSLSSDYIDEDQDISPKHVP